MKPIFDMTAAEKQARLSQLRTAYEEFRAQGLKLDMSRGKPGPEQLDLTMDMLACPAADNCRAEGVPDVRNYGGLEGLPAARALFADILGVAADEVIVGGNSSLNLMCDYICTAMVKGICGGQPWMLQGNIKFLCPAPGYDRHFAITQYFGVEMINVDMTADGPDMDAVERLVTDPAIKGMWCVPMYSNPGGVTYSDETVRRLAALRPAAPDFRVMWDNAYCLHHLYDGQEASLLNVMDEAKKQCNEDLFIQFCSTSKISFPGAGVAALAASVRNIADIRSRLTLQTIGYDKLNMLRHLQYFGDLEGIRSHMRRQAEVLRPKFGVVAELLAEKLGGRGIASWQTPHGGYFVSVDVADGCAKRTVALCREAGVTMTGAGATYPYGNDPRDRNIRIAPTYPSVTELRKAMELFCLCAEIAVLERA